MRRTSWSSIRTPWRRFKEDVVHDFPQRLADGGSWPKDPLPVVNGEVLLEKGEHTGSHPAK